MDTLLRRVTYSSLGLLWLTGSGWLVLQYFFQRPTAFGVAPHPLEPRLLVTHGVLALVATFFIGWVAGTHIGEHWRRRLNRTSGLTLIALFALLAVTGLGSYYLTSDSWRSGTALVHETAGVLAIVPALAHWFWRRKARP